MSNKQNIRDAIAFFSIVTLLFSALYFFWAKPYNDMLMKTVECMNKMGDHSQEAYNTCAEQIRESGASDELR